MKHAYITVSILLLVAPLAAQDYCPSDMPPADAIVPGGQVSEWSSYVAALTDDDPAVYVARIEAITGGIRVNWMAEPPPWALEPVPESVYLWEQGYGAYCRHLSAGTDRTRLEWCATDCVSVHPHIPGAVVYQRLEWSALLWTWEIVVRQMMLPHRKQRITPHSVAGRANHD